MKFNAKIWLVLGMVSLLGLTGCVSTPPDPPPEPVLTIAERVDNLEKLIAGLGAGGASATDVKELKTQMATVIKNQQSDGALITTLTKKVAALEVVEEEEEEAASKEDTTRWTFSQCRILEPVGGWHSGWDYIEVVIWDIDPRKIKDADLYEIAIAMYNPTDTDKYGLNGTGAIPINLKDAQVKLVLRPEDYITVDEDDTYLDADSPPWVYWDTDFITRTREGREICKSIEFISDRADWGIIQAGETLVFGLVLELYYD